MTKARSNLTVHGVIDRAFDEVGGRDEVLVILPHRKRAALYDMTNPDRDGEKVVRITYDDVRALTRAGARAFVEDLARYAGGQFVPNDGPGASVAGLQVSAANIMTETGEALTVLAASMADGVVDPREAEAIAGRLLDIKTAVTKALEIVAAFKVSPAS